MKWEPNLKLIAWLLWPTLRQIRLQAGLGAETGLPSGESHAGRVYVEIHTLSTGIEYDLRISKWPPDLYPSGFKGSAASAEIEVLTAALGSFSLTLF